MTPNGPAPLVLAPEPAAAAAARRYVRAELAGLGREDLIDAAELGVSELVTNAAIHARTPVTVRIRALDGGGVRIEVVDASAVPPSLQDYGPRSSVGRGLRLLNVLGDWGCEPGTGPGRQPMKVVWFEPRADVDEAAFAVDAAGGPADQGPDEPQPGPAPPEVPRADTRAVLGRYDASGAGEPVTVRMLRFPLRLFAAAREHHDELLREFSLLALAPAGTPGRELPPGMLELVETLGGRYRASAARADAARDAAMARGELSIDLTYQVPASTKESLLALQRLMDEADRLCRGEQLLTLAETPLQRRFRHWFTGQFVDQIDGRPASPWTGPLQE